MPGKIRYDNLKPAVVRVLRGRDRTESERFIALRSQYSFDSFFCRPGVEGAHEKGGVEGEIGRFRRRHLGQHTQALTCYQHVLTLSRDLGDRYNEATALTHLGDTHHTAGNRQATRDARQQALTILDDLDHPDAAQVRTKLAGLEPPADQATL